MKHAISHVHFVGIGGSGMSGIAEILHNLGYTVSGSDQSDSETARRLSSLGIRVGAVAPGMVETPMTQGMNQKARDALVAAIPVGRIGLPEDLWLAVKVVLECDYFNGRCIDVDGGLSM